jgi:cell division septal protein FtsQ
MIRFLQGITRRSRRRIFIISTLGVMGLAVPVWVPRLLSTLPAFQVDKIHVQGTRHVLPDEIKRLAFLLEPDASVWDDPTTWANRVRTHPMVREVTIRRVNFSEIEIVVVEKRPVALIATPQLWPINGEGRLLPLDATKAQLDLPIIGGITEVEGDQIADVAIRELAFVLDQLDRANPEFVSIISEVTHAVNGGYRFSMLPSAAVGVVFLPHVHPVKALRRVSIALGQIDDPWVARADARFAGQVVVARVEAR